MLGHRARPTQPAFDACVAETGDFGCDQAPLRRTESDGLASTGGFAADTGQCCLAGTIVWKRVSVRFEHRTKDLSETSAAVLHARVGSRARGPAAVGRPTTASGVVMSKQ
jgi:hypothetical protein